MKNRKKVKQCCELEREQVIQRIIEWLETPTDNYHETRFRCELADEVRQGKWKSVSRETLHVKHERSVSRETLASDYENPGFPSVQ